MKHTYAYSVIFASSLAAILLGACVSQNPQPGNDRGRVEYETGSEHIAAAVRQSLPKATSKVERGHGHTFNAGVVVHVFASEQAFRAATGYQGYLVAGVSTPSGLFLAPQQPEAAVQILTHELSHVLLRQWVGSYRFHRTPIWFREGLATWVANGGGAGSVNPEQAKAAIESGKTFAPNLVEGTIFRKGAPQWQLSHHMFYRQSALFIDFLARNYTSEWNRLLDNVHQGQDFSKSYRLSFDIDIERLWLLFVDDLG